MKGVDCTERHFTVERKTTSIFLQVQRKNSLAYNTLLTQDFRKYFFLTEGIRSLLRTQKHFNLRIRSKN